MAKAPDSDIVGASRNVCSHVAYLYDGSLEGLLSAVFLAYERHEVPDEVIAETRYQPRLGQDSLLVETDFERAKRVRRGVERVAGSKAFLAVMRASACDDYEVGTIVYRFIRHVMARPREKRTFSVLDEQANPVVGDLIALSRRMSNECEKMRQFVRFSQLENGVWFARCNPSASVVPFVMGHFAARLNVQPFILYDERHRLAGVYDGRSWQLVSGEAVHIPAATEREAEIQEAWKRFYDTLSVDARYNPELRRNFMPMRLWPDLTEMHPLHRSDSG